MDAVSNHSFAVIDHDTSLAPSLGMRVVETLKPYDIEPHMDFVAGFYVAVNLNRFPLSARRWLTEAVQTLTYAHTA